MLKNNRFCVIVLTWRDLFWWPLNHRALRVAVPHTNDLKPQVSSYWVAVQMLTSPTFPALLSPPLSTHPLKLLWSGFSCLALHPAQSSGLTDIVEWHWWSDTLLLFVFEWGLRASVQWRVCVRGIGENESFVSDRGAWEVYLEPALCCVVPQHTNHSETGRENEHQWEGLVMTVQLQHDFSPNTNCVRAVNSKKI